MSRAPKQDSLDVAALQLGRRNAQKARGHLHRALNHLESATEAIRPILGVSDEFQDGVRVTAAVLDHLKRLEARLEDLDRRRLGPKVTDLAVAQEAVRRPLLRTVGNSSARARAPLRVH